MNSVTHSGPFEIALSDTGEQFIARFTKDYYRLFIAEWRSLLLKYKEVIGRQPDGAVQPSPPA